MACPLCGEQCHCSATPADESHVSLLIDPESYEDSEQKFSATIAGDDTSLVHDLMDDGDGDAPLGDISRGATASPVVTPQLSSLTPSSPVAAVVTTTLIEAASSEP